jgi:oligosaccharide repeat unit polymerase
MIYLIYFNVLLYIFALALYWIKKHRIDLLFFILSLYTLIAAMGIFYFKEVYLARFLDLSLLGFIFPFIIILLFLAPLSSIKTSISENIIIRDDRFVNFMTYYFIIASLISMIILLPKAINVISTGEWALLRNNYYDEGIKVYNNQVERIALISMGYLHLFGTIIFFYFLINKKHNALFLVILGLCLVVPTFLGATLNAARGDLINLIFEIIICYIFFRNSIPENIKKILKIVSVVMLIFIITYLIAVTLSRFGDTESNSSLVEYFGMPLLVLNHGISHENEFLYGGYFFYPFFGFHPENLSFLGSHFNYAFFTFVGALYIDWGPIGTMLIALTIPLFIRTRVSSKMYLEDIYLVVSYSFYLARGMFVIGHNEIYTLLGYILVYLILKFSGIKNISKKTK